MNMNMNYIEHELLYLFFDTELRSTGNENPKFEKILLEIHFDLKFLKKD